MLRDKDRLVENPARGSWRIISLTGRKETNQLEKSSKSHNPAPMLNPIKIDLMNNKKTKIRNRSRRKSYYGKKIGHRRITQRKQSAMETARVREPEVVEPAQEAKPIENVTPTKTKIPWRAPRRKPSPGDYVIPTIASGIYGCVTLLGALAFIAIIGDVWSHFTLLFPIMFIICAIHSLKNSRGGW